MKLITKNILSNLYNISNMHLMVFIYVCLFNQNVHAKNETDKINILQILEIKMYNKLIFDGQNLKINLIPELLV